MEVKATLRSGYVEIQEEDAAVPSFNVTWDDFKDLVSNLHSSSAGVKKESAQKRVSLCEGLIEISPNFFSHNAGTRSLALVVPETRADLRFSANGGTKVYKDCIFPQTYATITFQRTVNVREDLSLSFGSMNLSMLHAGTKYRYPFPNVHSDGAICWGSVRLPNYINLGNISGASLYVAAFREANFNTDLTPSLRRFSGLTEYFQALSGAAEFPYSKVI
jgi:hypothetical protein